MKYTFVVFRPFLNELITGKIKGCSPEGVQSKFLDFYSLFHCNKHFKTTFSFFFFQIVTLGFFDDIQIPAACLQHPSRFDEDEQVWIWEFENQGSKHDLFMDVG